jgi:hypothetical protein
VGPFEFMILFLSFIYTAALTHLLFAMTRMLRHRRTLTFSWPHFLWMLVALLNLTANWIGGYDFHRFERLTLSTITIGLIFTILVYFQCSLVSPDFEEGESYDMKEFHARESVTYMGVSFVVVLAAVIVNFLADFALSIGSMGQQNLLVAAMIPPTVIPIFVRRPWVQLVMPLFLLTLQVTQVVLFYPVLEQAAGG